MKNKNLKVKNKKLQPLLFKVFSVAFIFSFLIFNYVYAQPNQSPGTGSGAISADSSGNLGVGTSTLTSTIKLKVVSGGATSANFGLQVLQPAGGVIMVARGDGRVGIGTSAPNYPLTVNGNVEATTFIGNLAASNVTAAVFGAGNFAFPASLGVGTSSQVGLPAALSIFGTGASALVNINNSTVGKTAIRFQSNGTTVGGVGLSGYFEGDSSTDTSLVADGASLGLRFYTGGSAVEKMVIDSSGNVSVGSTASVAKLYVDNGSTAQNAFIASSSNASFYTGYVRGVYGLLVDGGTGTGNYAFRVRSNGGASDYFAVRGDGNVGIANASPSYKLDVTGQINSSAGLCIAADCKTSWSQVGGGGSGTGWSRTSTNVHLTTSTDNVGIGTTTPAVKLHVSAGSGESVVRIGDTGGTTVPVLQLQTSASQYSWAIAAQKNVSNALEFTPSTAAGGTTFSTPVMTLLRTGSVGIGTTTPAYPLVVNGNIQAAGGSFLGNIAASNVTSGVFGSGNFAFPSSLGVGYSSQVGLPGTLSVRGVGNYTAVNTNVPSYFGNDTTGANVVVGAQGLGGVIQGRDTTSAGVLLINPYGGNVGVGTTTVATSKMTIADGAQAEGANGLLYVNKNWATNFPALVVRQSGAGGNAGVINGLLVDVQGVATSKSFEIQNAGTPRVTVLNGGNFGIGTAAPDQKLEVSSVTSGGSVMVKINAATDNYAQLGYYENGSLKWNIYNEFANDNLSFGNSGGAKMQINQAGDVGIGTNPGVKLDVAGVVKASTASIDPDAIGSGVALGTISDASWSANGISFGPGSGQMAAIGSGANVVYFGLQTGAANSMTTMMTLTAGTPNTFSVTGNVNASNALCISTDCRTSWSAVSGGWMDNGTTITLTTASDNVGIGGAATEKLTIRDTNKTYASALANQAIYTTDSQAADLGGSLGLGGIYTGTSQTLFGYVSGRKENGTAGNYGGYLSLGTRENGVGSPAERLRITSTGDINVIGSASYATLNLGASGDNANAQIRKTKDVTGYPLDIFLSMHPTVGASSFRMFTHPGQSVPIIQTTTDQNVGIGFAPLNKLHVGGNIGATGWIGAGCEVACSNDAFSLMYADGSSMFYENASDYTQITGGNTNIVGGDIKFNNVRRGIIGTYDAAQTQAIWSMGAAYALNPTGASNNYGDFYGIGWSYEPDYGGAGNNPQSKAGLAHQALFMQAGVTRTAIGVGIWTSGNITTLGGVTASGNITSPTASFTTSVTGLEVYADSWFRNNAANTGLYNQVNGNHIYSESAGSWAFTAGVGSPAAGITLRASHAGTQRGVLYSDGSNFGLLNNAGSWAVQIPNGGVAVNLLGTVTVGGGTGKINVGTVDPIYTINGKKYATYLPAMTGQKEETTGVLDLESDGEGNWLAEIDFKNQEEASDIWLFAKVTDLQNQFDKMMVLLTPSFNGNTWYERDVENMKLIIHGEHGGEVSYRLTATRFDAGEWGNRADKETAEGFNLDKLLGQ